MDEKTIDEIIGRLDLVMSDTPRNVGVAMGDALFAACKRRGLLSIEDFSVAGSGFLPHRLPAYRGKNFAFVHPELTEWDFQIGERSRAQGS